MVRNTVLFHDFDLLKCHFYWHADYVYTLSVLHVVLKTLITFKSDDDLQMRELF